MGEVNNNFERNSNFIPINNKISSDGKYSYSKLLKKNININLTNDKRGKLEKKIEDLGDKIRKLESKINRSQPDLFCGLGKAYLNLKKGKLERKKKKEEDKLTLMNKNVFSKILPPVNEKFLSFSALQQKFVLPSLVDSQAVISPQTPESFELMAMRNALGLGPADVSFEQDAAELKKIDGDKKEFMLAEMKEVPSKEIAKIINQNKRFPIMKAAVKELAMSYENWDLTLPENLLALQERIKKQHNNLLSISNIISLIQENFNPNDLMQLTLFNEKVKEIMIPYIKGEKLLNEGDNKEIFKKVLMDEIHEIIKKSQNSLSKEELSERRKGDPISKEAISAQARLFKAEREAKAEALNLSQLSKQGGSANIVVPLKDAFYKEGAGGERAAGTMEKFMWDIAVLMGVEKLFTATKETTLRTGLPGGGTALGWSKEGDLVEIPGVSPERKGGIQAAQAGGVTLEKYIGDIEFQPDQKTISKENVIRASITHYMFGMFDAHNNNILVDKEGNLKFFDNTRSMPSSNGVIQWGGLLLPTFRSGLMSLDASYEDLTTEERQIIKEEVEKMQSNIANLEKFLNDPMKKKELSKLPLGWWNSEQSLLACKERINGLAKAINNENSRNLRDVILEANPDIKYFAALMVIVNKKNVPYQSDSECEKKSLSTLGFTPVDELVKNLVATGIDPEEVRSWCKDPSLSFSEIINKGVGQEKDWNPDKQSLRHLHAKQIISEYERKAAIDMKDVNRDEIPAIVLHIIKEKMAASGIAIQRWSSGLTPFPSIINKKNYYENIVAGLASELFLFYKGVGQNEIKKIPLDYLSQPGVVKVDQPELIVRNLSAQAAEERLNEQPIGTFLFRSSSAPGAISASYVNENSEVRHIRFQIENGKLIDLSNRQEFNNLEEIIDKYKEQFLLSTSLLLSDLR